MKPWNRSDRCQFDHDRYHNKLRENARILIRRFLRSKRPLLKIVGFLFIAISTIFATQLLQPFSEARAAGVLTVEILAGYNLVVDSNVESPSTYAPSVATVMGRFCNTGDTQLTGVQGFIGDYTAGTPGTYPTRNSADAGFITQHPHLAGTGLYSFTHIGGRMGSQDASRFIGTLDPGTCAIQYWHFTYPRRGNPNNTGNAVWGTTNDPNDDLWLDFDIWGTSNEASNDNASQTMTMRNEISAMANKIEPQGGMWFNTASDTVTPGETITSNGINYNLGNINKGFDNDGDFLYDYNAWLQPTGDPNFDPSCFRLIRTWGTLTISRSGGQPDLIIDFTDQLYFTNLPSDNTGGIGEVHYQFLALDGPCSTAMSPYQEVASGADNEKFNADFGTSLPPLGSSEPEVTLDKSGNPTIVIAGLNYISYDIDFTNTGSSSVGLPLYNMPLVISDSIPTGTQYVSGSASSTISTTILYSTDNGVTWSTTEPAASSVTDIQWWLNNALAASASGQVSFQVDVIDTYNPATDGVFIENCADSSFGNNISFANACTSTLIEGTNSIGDIVWQDDDGDGVFDTGESGLSNITVYLYSDTNSDGVLDSGDQLVMTDVTDGSGNYSFDLLPDSDFIVKVDGDDTDIPDGHSHTNESEIAVTGLGTVISSPYNDADFGFGPVLRLDKILTTGNPAYEGDLVSFNINLINTRPGDGTGSGGVCSFEIWAPTEDGRTSTLPINKQWTNPANALDGNGPNYNYASSDYTNAINQLAGTGFSLGSQTGSITQVEALFSIYIGGTLTNDNAASLLFFNNVQIA